MNRILILVMCILILTTTVLCSSCSEAKCAEASDLSTTTGELRNKQYSEVLGYDFCNAIADCNFVTFANYEDESNVSASTVSMMAKNVGKYIPEREFTEKELIALGVGKVSEDRSTSIFMSLFKVYFHYRHNGCLPASGLELYPELLTQAGYNELLNSSDDASMYEKYYDGINPITGKFIPSFTANTWTKGAWNIEIIDDPEEAVKLSGIETITHPVLPDKDGVMSPDKKPVTLPVTKAWRVTIYGENPGEVIVENYIWPMSE